MLKPLRCPLCGENSIRIVTSQLGEYQVYCPKCFVRIQKETKEEAIKAWNKRYITGKTSDGYHSFDELYYHRAILTSVICNTYPDLSWKSKLHHDGTMYNNYFIVGIETPKGQATYHYPLKHWSKFNVKELERAPEWDGHTPSEAIKRILSINTLLTTINSIEMEEKNETNENCS